MNGDEVKLIGYWASPFALRVHWALKLKGVEYEYIEEELPQKSEMLLKFNPVHKKVPVLVHNGKPIAESLVILEYIDETWKQNPLLGDDPFERSVDRFWAGFVDSKCVPALMGTFMKVGEEQEKAAKETRENFKTLESALNGKPFFGGDTLNLVDIAAGWLGCWARVVEDIVEIKLIEEQDMPLLTSWIERIFQVPFVKECMPDKDRLIAHNKVFHEFLTGARTG